MLRVRFLVLAFALTAFVACQRARGEPSSERVEPFRAPEQTPIVGEDPVVRLDVGDERFVLTRVAHYRIAARVLSRARYFLGWQSELSPVDLALGWGYMADARVDRFIDWRQAGRWYFYTWSADSPYDTESIRVESSNVHIVPGSGNLRRALLEVRAGEPVLLIGSLVNARRADADSGVWTSSLSREDVGDGACELMLVDRLVKGGLEYR